MFQSIQRLTYLLFRSKDPGVRLSTYDGNDIEVFDHTRVRVEPGDSTVQGQ